MKRIIEALEKKHAIKMLLLIFGDIGYKDKFRQDLEIPIDTIDTRLRELKEVGILGTPETQEQFPFRKIYPLTKIGDNIARKLSYVFDEEKEVLQLPKSVTNDLNRLIKLNRTDKTFEEFCIDAIKKEIQLVLSGMF